MKGNPFEGEVQPRMVARYLKSPDRLASMLNNMDVGGTGASPAAILADIVNAHRADTKALAGVLGVEMEVDLMTPERTADLLAGLTDGQGVELVEVFNDLAHDRDRLLCEALDADEYDEFMESKVAVMHTPDPETWDDESPEA